MLKIIIITVLMVEFTNALADKWGISESIVNWSRKQQSKFIYRLFNCNLCKTFHLGWILWLLVSFLNNNDITYILTPFCVLGALKLIKNDF